MQAREKVLAPGDGHVADPFRRLRGQQVRPRAEQPVRHQLGDGTGHGGIIARLDQVVQLFDVRGIKVERGVRENEIAETEERFSRGCLEEISQLIGHDCTSKRHVGGRSPRHGSVWRVSTGIGLARRNAARGDLRPETLSNPSSAWKARIWENP